MTEARRERLPDRRASETFALQCAGLNYIATISRFNDVGAALDIIAADGDDR